MQYCGSADLEKLAAERPGQAAAPTRVVRLFVQRVEVSVARRPGHHRHDALACSADYNQKTSAQLSVAHASLLTHLSTILHPSQLTRAAAAMRLCMRLSSERVHPPIVLKLSCSSWSRRYRMWKLWGRGRGHLSKVKWWVNLPERHVNQCWLLSGSRPGGKPAHDEQQEHQVCEMCRRHSGYVSLATRRHPSLQAQRHSGIVCRAGSIAHCDQPAQNRYSRSPLTPLDVVNHFLQRVQESKARGAEHPAGKKCHA